MYISAVTLFKYLKCSFAVTWLITSSNNQVTNREREVYISSLELNAPANGDDYSGHIAWIKVILLFKSVSLQECLSSID